MTIMLGLTLVGAEWMHFMAQITFQGPSGRHYLQYFNCNVSYCVDFLNAISLPETGLGQCFMGLGKYCSALLSFTMNMLVSTNVCVLYILEKVHISVFFSPIMDRLS